ncbi:MAG TPA: cobyric acid synthase [Longimicrobiales bacterium]
MSGPAVPAPTLMVQGTASGVGKSLLVTALCRIFARRGVHVVPFKAQNMSNNAAVTVDGGEVGRAQALQARAAGVRPDVRMNPVLLKPLADTRSDVVVLGRSDPDAAMLPWHERRERLWPVVAESLDALRAEADLVIIEGAGSPAETNLRRSDIVNMAVAHHAAAPVLLAADIDRGGAFAALYGTWSLLDTADRARIRGFILNRFRGDPSLLSPAPDDLRRRTGVPTLGIVPYTRHRLPEEDAMGLASAGNGTVTIAAVRVPHIANFDDLDPLAAEPGARVRWVDRPESLDDAAAIILPGTRNTLADLRWLWDTGLAAAIRARCRAGIEVVGLCGGYQMLGRRVRDPAGIEAGGECAGLGLLDIETVLAPEKTTRPTRAAITPCPGPLGRLAGTTIEGYEIHHGHTTLHGTTRAWLVAGEEVIGAVAGSGPPGGSAGGSAGGDRDRCAIGGAGGAGGCGAGVTAGRNGRGTDDGAAGAIAPPAWGAYLHGLFHNDAFRHAWLDSLCAAHAESAWELRVEREIDRIADVVENALDMGRIEALVHRSAPCD